MRRDGRWVRLAASELVPGDTIRLPLGAIVPADALIVSGSVLVDQSMITGESVPVDAGAGSRVYAGSLVRRGQAIAEVTATARPRTVNGVLVPTPWEGRFWAYELRQGMRVPLQGEVRGSWLTACGRTGAAASKRSPTSLRGDRDAHS